MNTANKLWRVVGTSPNGNPVKMTVQAANWFKANKKARKAKVTIRDIVLIEESNPTMTTAEIIPYRYYEDPTNGRTFSLFTSWKTHGAVLVEKGFTIKWPDGTYGCGKPPFVTIDEAKAYLAKVPKNFTGMHALGS